MVQVGPASDLSSTLPNAILNGLEVMKMSNSAGSLDGSFSSNGEYESPKLGQSKTRIAAIFVLAMGATSILLLVIGVSWWQRRPKDKKRGSFSSWLLPLNSTQFSFSSMKSKSSYSSDKSTKTGFGRSFIVVDLCNAMQRISLMIEKLSGLADQKKSYRDWRVWKGVSWGVTKWDKDCDKAWKC